MSTAGLLQSAKAPLQDLTAPAASIASEIRVRILIPQLSFRTNKTVRRNKYPLEFRNLNRLWRMPNVNCCARTEHARSRSAAVIPYINTAR